VLPIKEALEGIADDAFAVVGDRPRYIHDGAERMQQRLHALPAYVGVVVQQQDLNVTTTIAEFITEAHWALKETLEALLPDARTTMRVHRIALKSHPDMPSITQLSVLVTMQVGPFKVKREYLVVDDGAATELIHSAIE
jgi:hypothetical protein